MKRVPTILMSMAIIPVAHAPLGETEAELVARFGQPKVRSTDKMGAQGKLWDVGPRYYFQQGDWQIHCVLVEGRCAWIDYGKPGGWTEEQVQLVLGSNSQGAKWTETTNGSGRSERTWKRADGASARWLPSSGMKLIVPAYERARQVIEAKAKAAASQKPKI